MIKYFFGLSLFAGLLLIACNKSTIVGSEILTDDYVDVGFTDTFSIKTLNIEADSARIYPATNTLLLLGSIEDPVFGNSYTEVYTQLRKIYDIPDMSNSVLDSVVLSVRIDPSGFYGDTMASQTLEVYELGESLIDYDSIYTTQQFQKGMFLGSKTFNPNANDTTIFYFNGDTSKYTGIFRIPLDYSFGERLLADTARLQNDTLIQELTNGLVFKSTASNSAVFGISNGVFLDNYNNKVILYFTRGDTVSVQHILTLGGKRGLYIDHDRSNSVMGPYLNNEEGSDTLLFLSGMQNNNIELSIPNLDGLDDLLINYAEIEFYINSSLMHPSYDRIDQVYAYNVGEDGKNAYIYDLNIGISSNLLGYFDGTVEETVNDEGTILYKYNINITNELKKRIEEEDTETKIRIVPKLSTDRAYRSVLYGPGSHKYPAKLKITYTQK
jgi:hypothetical protein